MQKVILVTGSHRSGSTWLGHILSSAPNAKYIHEPFNLDLNYSNSPLNYWFQHLSDNTEKNLQENVKSYLKSFYEITITDVASKALKIRSFKGLQTLYCQLKDQYANDKIIIKDPIAIMSAEWLYKYLNYEIVVSIRHPAAFVASLVCKGWKYDFNNFNNQKELMNNYLHDYKDIIEEYSKNDKNILKQGILLWNSIYATVFQYKLKYGSKWHFIRNEDLSKNPLEEFEKLFVSLNIDFNETVIQEIKKTSLSQTSTDLERNSLENIKSWQNRLTTEEINMIKTETKHVWEQFYTESDWN